VNAPSHDSTTHGSDERAHGSTPRVAVVSLLRWFQPYVADRRGLVAGIAVGTVVVIVCQAVIPWLVEMILHHGEWNMPLIGTLIALVIVQLTVGYATHLAVHTASIHGTHGMRRQMFERLLRSRVLRQQGLLRSSVVLRITQDVDRVAEAYESTLAFGIPGLARLIVSLALLSLIDWHAGAVMTLMSIAFLLLRRRIGPRLLAADRERLAVQSELGDTVDETISNASLITGLRLRAWISRRFEHRSEELAHSTHHQGIVVNRLILAAHTTALVGLVAVVLFALTFHLGEDLAVVAAALLYVEGAVRGLESLPPWLRDVQRSTVSQSRIEDLLDAPLAIEAEPMPAAAAAPADRALHVDGVTTRLPSGGQIAGTIALPVGGVIGLVTTPDTEPEEVLELLSGALSADAGRILLGSLDVRDPHAESLLFHVPSLPDTLDVSITELFTAVSPDVTPEEIVSGLRTVGLGHVATQPTALTAPIGREGLALMVAERQRLVLAAALAAGPQALMVGPILPFADVDTALPLLQTLRTDPGRSTIVALRSPELAESVDEILFAGAGTLRLGTHQELLVSVPAYASLWEQRLSTTDVDLSVLGIGASDEERLLTRLVTEHYSPGDLIYRQGSPADRILFIISGHVEITTSTAGGQGHRVAVLGPGNHCGDLRLTVGEQRGENAFALDDCVVRSLSREAISAGLTGLLDRTPTERRIIESILRNGSATREELAERLGDVDAAVLATSLALLTQDGALTDRNGVLSAVLKRAGKSGAADLLDRIGGL
jgi:ABC-type multidrug transport system fused ATPase/permease subunit/CRP-like cAMP-binding protein